MSIYTKLIELQKDQIKFNDDVRLFYDGSVKIKTLTDNGDMGWYVLARPVNGASPSINRYFNVHPDGHYLKVRGMREAITLRDGILTAAVESRMGRRASNDLRTR